ncbi:MAG: helix-turn-helix domain-containing protein [Muribaculaceae bacterium]
MMKHIVAAFLTNIMMLHHHYHSDLINEGKGTKGSYIILDRFMELLGLYHSREREVKFYANKMCITPKHLSNVVRKTSGKNAADWISEFVILEAKSMLIYSNKNIQEVSQSLNFPTQSAFGKYFKCQVGMSPSEFIETNRTFKSQ